MSGNLYVVATPIGNLGDISDRAIRTLQQSDLIAAEDTRHSKALQKHFAIRTKTITYHEYNEEKVTPQLIERLLLGQSISLISDAGTPLISDPGYRLVAAAHDNNIIVVPVPGPSAIITALSVAGLPVGKFIFEGYLPKKKEARKNRLDALKNESRTLVFYEVPHRIVESMKIMQNVFGDKRKVTMARELTKQFEQIVRASLREVNNKLENKEIKIKGEFVVIIRGAEDVATTDEKVRYVNQILSEKLSPKDAVSLTARITGRKKNEVYRLVLQSAK